jgi:hypothetical protein
MVENQFALFLGNLAGMLIIYSIPHSMFGSQPDPETGEIIQGWIRILN